MQPIIEINHVSKKYESADGIVNALDDVSFSVEKGDIFGIIGASGSGKSTLIRCINQLERPDNGEVFFNGVDLTKQKEKALRKTRIKLGMIFQNFCLMEQRTALSNVCFPLELQGIRKADAEKIARDYLTIVGLNEKANAYPSQLSGGQKQRVAIARALASNPDVLLLDEATSALDPSTTDSIVELLKDIHNKTGLTVIAVSHDLRVVANLCTKVAVINGGKIPKVGSTAEVFGESLLNALGSCSALNIDTKSEAQND